MMRGNINPWFGMVAITCSLLVITGRIARAQAPSTGGETPTTTQPRGRTVLHRDARDIEREEALLAPELRKLHRDFRLASMLTGEVKQARMVGIAQQVAAQLPAAIESEKPGWLRLQQSAYLCAGDVKAALAAQRQRYALLEQSLPGDALAEAVIGEAEFALAKRDYDIADVAYKQAADSSVSAAPRRKALLDRTRVFIARGDLAGGIHYLHETIDRVREKDAVFVCDLQFSAAKLYHQSGDLARARSMLLTIETEAAGTPAAERARQQRDDWENPRGED